MAAVSRRVSEDTQCPANWDDRSTLVFRDVRQSGEVSVTDGYQYVDIRVNTQSDADDKDEHDAFLTLSWTGMLESQTCFSTCTICMNCGEDITPSAILNRLCEDNFQTLRHFVAMLFREYRIRILALRNNPLTFDIVHMNLTEFEYLQNNINVLEKNIRNLICEDKHCDFTLDLKRHVSHVVSRECDNAEMSETQDASISDTEHGKHKHKEEMNSIKPESLQKQLKAQRESIDASYNERKTQNEKMLASIKRLLHYNRAPKSLDNTPLALCSEDTKESPRTTRDVGDGAESLSPSSRMSTGKPTLSTPISRSVDGLQDDRFSNQQSQYPELSTPITTYADAQKHNRSSCQQSQHTELSNKGSAKEDGDVQYTNIPKEKSANLTESLKSDELLGACGGEASQLTSNKVQDPLDNSKMLTKSENASRSLEAVAKCSSATGIMPDCTSKHPHVPINNVQSAAFQSTESRTDENRKTKDNRRNSVQKATGLDTLLCIDTSGGCSTCFEDDGIQEMRDVALEFIEGVDNIASQYGVEENIGIVACVGGSWIKHQPSSDYTRVRGIIRGMHLDSKPLINESIQTGLDFMRDKCEIYQVSRKYTLNPRLIVITNYDITGSNFDDIIDEKDKLICTLRSASDMDIADNAVRWIPVGQANDGYFQTLAHLTHGEHVERSDIKLLCKYQQTKVITWKILSFVETDWVSLTGGTTINVDFLVDMFGSHLSGDQQMHVQRVVQRILDSSTIHTDNVDRSNHERKRTVPPLGSKVVRGEDWMWNDQDSNGPGTVIGHSDGFVSVVWESGNNGQYRYGAFDCYDVKVIVDQSRLNYSDYVIAVGCEVQRGPDWYPKSGKEDGGLGGIGVVIESRIDGKVKVRWLRNGYVSMYNCGSDDKLEVIVRDPNDNLSKDSHTNEDTVSEPPLLDGVLVHQPQIANFATRNSVDGLKNHDAQQSNNSGNDHSLTKDAPNGTQTRDSETRTKSAISTNTAQYGTQEIKDNEKNATYRSKDDKGNGVPIPRDGAGQDIHWSRDNETPQWRVATNYPQRSKINNSNMTQEMKDNVGDGTFSFLETDGIYKCVWQWEECNSNWQTYSVESNLKIEQCFNRRPHGSCLIQRENRSYRVLFKEMEEKSIENNSRRKVQRISATKEDTGSSGKWQ